jgi:putrescine importer
MNKQNTPEQELQAFGYNQQLHRSLNLWHLTAFGLNYMIPIAPAIIFGFILTTSGGTVVLPYLLAFVGMSFTAMSYAVLIRKFPVAGSLYSYVARGLNPHIGFLAGWVLLLDYILIPTVTAMSSAMYIKQYFPDVSYEVWLFIFIIGAGVLNLFNVKLMAKLGIWLLLIGEIVIFVGFFVWSKAVIVNKIGVGHFFSMTPFDFSSFGALATATSIAVLSYLGFDAITTLSEEAINPKRDIPRAIFLSVGIGAVTMLLTGYIGTLVIPNWKSFANNPNWVSTTLFHVSQITGGKIFALFYTSGFLLAMVVFNVVATAAGARLLFGMGRDGALPAKIFGAVNRKWKTPHWNIIIIVCLEFLLGSLFQLDKIAELVNYGALLGFILLNVTVIVLFIFKKQAIKENNNKSFIIFIKYIFFPALGICVLGWVFLNMHINTLIFGTIWLVIGVVYGLYISNGYRKLPPNLKL